MGGFGGKGGWRKRGGGAGGLEETLGNITQPVLFLSTEFPLIVLALHCPLAPGPNGAASEAAESHLEQFSMAELVS